MTNEKTLHFRPNVNEPLRLVQMCTNHASIFCTKESRQDHYLGLDAKIAGVRKFSN